MFVTVMANNANPPWLLLGQSGADRWGKWQLRSRRHLWSSSWWSWCWLSLWYKPWYPSQKIINISRKQKIRNSSPSQKAAMPPMAFWDVSEVYRRFSNSYLDFQKVISILFHLHVWEMSLIRIHIPHSRDKIASSWSPSPTWWTWWPGWRRAWGRPWCRSTRRRRPPEPRSYQGRQADRGIWKVGRWKRVQRITWVCLGPSQSSWGAGWPPTEGLWEGHWCNLEELTDYLAAQNKLKHTEKIYLKDALTRLGVE